MSKPTMILIAIAAVACASMAPNVEGSDPVFTREDPAVRIALATSAKSAKLSATGNWRIYDRTRDNLLIRGVPSEVITIDPIGGMLQATRASGGRTDRHAGPFLVRSIDENGLLTFNGKRYRGDLLVNASDTGLIVVNRLSVEQYLRGVVPGEIGKRTREEMAAVQAQAVAARSYSYSHFASDRMFDMYATVQDQVYGGVDVETPLTDEAVATTRGMVLKYAGKVLSNTPYHSTCGGSTAAVTEVWYSQPDQPYLRPVSDRIPGTDHFYCDPSPRFSWTQSFSGDQFQTVLAKYLSAYTSAPSGSLGAVRMVREIGRTQSDRVAALDISTDRGTYTLRGNDIRFVLRNPAGEILNSTYFTAEVSIGPNGVQNLTLRGRGYGHGIGMCQWGAIGRARAGQDYRTILTTYYPGTTVAPI